MARAPPFSSLPYEIVSQICRQPDLDKDDMIALRLTCKSYGVHDAATRSFGKLFEDITVLFSEHSFNMLINICKHPVFSHCIRSVKLSSIRCNKHESLQTTLNLLRLGDPLSNRPAGPDARLQALDNLSARIRSYTLRTRHESDLSRSNKPVELLTLAFKCLSRSGDRIALGIAIDETNSLGCGRVLCAKDVFSNLWYNAIYSTLEVLATAVSDANYSFGKLNIDTRAMDSHINHQSHRKKALRPLSLTALRNFRFDRHRTKPPNLVFTQKTSATPFLSQHLSSHNNSPKSCVPCQQLIALDNRDIAIMAPASFSSLPPELVSKICSDPGLEKKDLIALRLTSKAQGIHVSATKAFGKLCFTEVPLVYTKYSLKSFVEICQHPVFGPSIRKVQLSCVRVNPEYFHPNVEWMMDRYPDRDDLLESIDRLGFRTDTEEAFKVSDAQALLDKAFTQLAKTDHILQIAVSSDESKALGGGHVFIPEPLLSWWYADVPFALNLLLGSSNRSGCRVQELDIAASAREFSDKSNHDLSALMRSISGVSLQLGFIENGWGREPGKLIQWMKELLSWGTSIKKLDICLEVFADDGDDRNFNDFGQLISRLALEELLLSNMCISQRSMTDLLVALGPKLRRLVIYRCDIVGSWKQILISIQQNTTQLDYLEICYGGLISWSGVREYKGATAIRLGLEDMIRAHEVSSP
ncbi:hypothetical protein KCV07_g1806, partial [Aureobasidium melanogenum]